MRITASIVTYHTKTDDLDRLLACVEASSIEKLYVIDNSGNDSLRDYFAKKTAVKYVYNGANLGYGAAHNIAIRESIKRGAEYHIVMNTDIYWHDNVICTLLRYMDTHPRCGLIMPKILYPDGKTQYLCKLLPTPFDLFIRRFLPLKSIKRKCDNEYELHWSGYDKEMEVPVLSGCFMFMRNTVLEEVNGFDERYFMYAEDIDLCRRIGRYARTIFYPYVSIYHEYEKGSYKSKKLLKYHTTSVIKYFNKWGWLHDKERNEKNNMCKTLIRNLSAEMEC